MKIKEKQKLGIIGWYLSTAGVILLFLYSYLSADLSVSIIAFIIAMVLSKYKDVIPLPKRWEKGKRDVYR